MLKRFWMGILTILCSIGITIVISYAWFIKGLDVDPLATGSSTEAYYHSGTGTSTDPFIITTPRHLYNLAWLQYLGAYNKDKKSGTTFPATYFKVGLNSSITLDMTGWPLPPIGTTKYPFIGNFNGNGSTILNLTTTNKFSEFGDKHPSGVTGATTGDTAFQADNCGAIGFFGSVGPYNGTIISESDMLGDCTYDSEHNKVYNFYLNDTNVHTSRSTTLIGAVAGYVNAEISNVGVIEPHLNIQVQEQGASLPTSKLTTKTANLSDFAVVGYAEQQYTTQKTKTSTIIYNPTYDYTHFNFKGMGNQADWGGSMDLQKLYNRIKNSANAGSRITTSNRNYINKELQYHGFDISKDNLKTYGQNSNYQYKSWGGVNGAYLRDYSSKDYGNNYPDAFQCLPTLYKDVIKVTKTSNFENGFSIKSNNHYLNISSSQNSSTFDFNVSVSSDQNDYMVWVEESSGNGFKLYTYNEDDGKKYYLVGNNDLSIGVSNTNYSLWHGDDNSYYTTINTQNYYLKYFNGSWTLKPTYAISDGHNNYFKYENSTILNADSLEQASAFMFTEDGKIITSNGDYLRNSPVGTLSISNSNTNNVWTNMDNQIFNQNNAINYYLQYDDGWKLVVPSKYYIQYAGNYLYLNSNGEIQTSGTTNIAMATVFTFSDNLGTIGGEGTISTIINDITYYLKHNGSTLDITMNSNDNARWNSDGHGIYYNQNDVKLYIQKNSIWTLMDCPQILDGFYISYSGNYLSVDGTEISNSNNPITIWHQDSDNYIYTIINGTNYYLYAASGDVAGISTNKENPGGYGTVKRSGNTIYETGWTSYMLYYSRGWKYDNSTTYNLGFTDNYSEDYSSSHVANYIANNISSLSIVSKINIIKTRGATNIYERKEGIREPSVFNYIPINADDSSPYGVADNNTGYIMSGGYETSLNCDIRVSSFTKNSTIGAGITGSYNTSTKKFKDNSIYTIKENNLGFIKETSASVTGTTYDASLFTKYKDSKSQLQTTLSNSGSYVYGLHFMDSSISKNHLVLAPNVKINGTEHENYEMPEDCIDFTLASKGYINFFSGYYFSGNGGTNNSFFSLHEIMRDSSGNITQIRHILKVYERNSDGQYVYYYKDDDANVYGYYTYKAKEKVYETISSFNASDYTLKYDSDWIENPEAHGVSYDSHKTYIFYFEIPVNSGEYALGSVSGKTGTYLIYLDIGANASIVDRTTITQQSDVVNENMKYVNGIQILDGEAQTIAYTSDANSCVAVIKSKTTGTIAITRTGNSVSFGGTSLDSTYYDEALTVPDATLNVPKTTSTTKVLKYIDFNNGTKTLYYATVVDVDETRTFEVREINGNDNPIVVTNEYTQQQMEAALYGLLKIGTGDNAGYGVQDTAEGAITANSFATTSKVVEYHYTIPTSIVTNNGVDYTFDMSVQQVTGDETVGGKQIEDGTYEFADGYSSTHCYKLIGDDITYVFTQIPTGTTTTTFVVTTKDGTYTVTINGITIVVGNYTYTFSDNTIAQAQA